MEGPITMAGTHESADTSPHTVEPRTTIQPIPNLAIGRGEEACTESPKGWPLGQLARLTILSKNTQHVE